MLAIAKHSPNLKIHSIILVTAFYKDQPRAFCRSLPDL